MLLKLKLMKVSHQAETLVKSKEIDIDIENIIYR